MKSVFLSVFLALSGANLVRAQGVDANTPTQRAPKVPDKASAPASLPTKPRSPRVSADTNVYLARLIGVVIVADRAKVNPAGALPMTGVQVSDIPLLKGEDFPAVIQPYLDKPLTVAAIKDMQDDIILYCRGKNRPLIDVILLPQVVDNGVIQFWFLEGKVGEIRIENEGRKWFGDQFIRHQIRLSRLDTVESRQLLDDLDWVNRNPFRDVRVSFKQGKAVGESDVVVKVNDRLPWRPYVGYEDSGTRFTGEDRLLFGLNWGKAFGLDHQFNYQYTTDLDFDLLRAHSASYVAPLPWRHVLTVFGSYVEADADVGPEFNSRGTSWQVGLRYAMPLPRLGRYQHEVSGGFDFKRSNNTFEFGGITASESDADIAQFVATYSGTLPDRWGQSSFGLEAYASPGGLVGNNDDKHFQELRTDAKADYLYTRLSAERLTRLPWDCSWDVKGLLQLASTRLLPSEQLGLGGYRSVRGYSERLVNGDYGWIVNNEIRSPAWRLSNLLGKHGSADYLQLLAFFDYGEVRVNSATGDDQPPEATLTSVGVGLRYTLSKNLSFRFDYGWQLTDKNLSDEIGADHSRAHLGVLASY
jgi:hemolysin activation/secretion protein